MSMEKIGIKGTYEASVKESDGSISFSTGEQCNLILDSALNSGLLLSNTYLSIGEGVVTTPAVTDTALGNEIDSESCTFQSDTFTEDANGIMARVKTTANFTGLDANISELGVRRGGSSGTLITRALVKDENGNPTTISIASDQELNITYYIYIYIPLVLGSGTYSTEFGDLDWEIVPDGKRWSSSNIAAHANEFRLGWNTYYRWIIGDYNNYSATFVTDNVNNTQEVTIAWTAKTTDYTINSSGSYSYIKPYGTSLKRSHYVIRLTSNFTIPANYKAQFKFTIGWDRLE